jgi:hypothetical protein
MMLAAGFSLDDADVSRVLTQIHSLR